MPTETTPKVNAATRLAASLERRQSALLLSLDERVRALETRAIKDDDLHAGLTRQDGLTADAVKELTRSINDPKMGLIVELDRFRGEVAHDRKEFRAWIRGATAALSVVVTIATIVAPWVRDALEGVFLQ